MRRRWWAWAGLAVVVVGLLAIGSRGTPTTGTSDERLFGLAEQMKCLQCVGENVANSQAPIAVEMREEIRRQMQANRTDDEIFSYFADRYGERVLLTPAASGFTGIVWVIPVVVFALGGVGVAAVVSRRRSGDSPELTDADRQLVARARRGAAGEGTA